MGKIVFAGAMSHVLDPDYYDAACGTNARLMVEDIMEAYRQMGALLAARSPDALIVVADDHLNAFSFNAVPALCVRIGTTVSRMVQEDAEAFDKVLENMPLTYPLHEALANQILERGLASDFDLALSWEAPLDHAFLSPVNTLCGARPIPPLVPIWVNCFVAPQPTARRCFVFLRCIARAVAGGPWNVGIIATAGLSDFPALRVTRLGVSDTVFDRKILHWLQDGGHQPLR